MEQVAIAANDLREEGIYPSWEDYGAILKVERVLADKSVKTYYFFKAEALTLQSWLNDQLPIKCL